MRTNERTVQLAQPTQVIAVPMTSGWNFVKSVLRMIRNRIASNSLYDLDDRQLADIGLTRRDVELALNHSSLLEDPSTLLSRSARKRAQTRFQSLPHNG